VNKKVQNDISTIDSEQLYTPQFIVLWIANFFVVTSMGSFFLFPLFILDSGGRESDIGIMMGAMTLSSVLLRPWIAQMIDRFGRKRCFFVGTVVLAAMPCYYLFFHGNLSDFYIPLLIVRVVHGLGIAFGFAASFTYVIDIIPQNRLNEGLGMFGITALAGMAIGPAIAEPILNNFGFDGYFLSISAIGLMATVLLIFLPETYIADASNEEKISFIAVLKRRKTYGVALLVVIFGSAMAAQGGFVAPYVKQIGLPNASFFFVAYSGAAVITRLLGSRLADRIGEERIIPWAFIVSSLGFLLMIAVDSNGLLIVSGAIAGCGHGFIFPCLNALINRDEPPHIRGKIAGIFTGGMDLGLFTGSIFLGFVGDWFGYRPIFASASFFLCLGTVLFFIVLGKVVRPLEQQPILTS